MIIRKRPSIWRLFFIVRGSVVRKVAPQILLSAVIGALVSHFHETLTAYGFVLTPVPFTIIGIALSIFVGFKNNAAYDRYWEGRKLWGELINSMRTFSRQLSTFTKAEDDANRNRIVRKAISFAYALKARLRDEQSADSKQNEPNAILESLGLDLRELARKRAVEPQYIQSLDATLSAFANVQGGCERIHSTPIPFSYMLILHRTAYMYCFALPFGLVNSVGFGMPIVVGFVAYTFFGFEAIGEELEDPFGVSTNDLPLDALCRTIEIDLLESLGEVNLPAPIAIKDYQLT